MFDPYDSPLLLPPAGGNYEPEDAPEPDRVDYVLEGISRFTGLFALGISVTLIARWVTALLPFYWLGAIACILSLTSRLTCLAVPGYSPPRSPLWLPSSSVGLTNLPTPVNRCNSRCSNK